MKSSSKNIVLNVLFVIILSLLIVNFARNFASNDNMLTFQGLMEYLSNIETIPLIPINSLNIGGDWGWFNFIRDFLNLFTGLMTIAIWISTSAINCVVYLFKFVQLCFV